MTKDVFVSISGMHEEIAERYGIQFRCLAENAQCRIL